MAGHSIGGASAIAAMLNDSRVRAGVNMGGTTYARIPKGRFSRPFLFLRPAQRVPGERDNSWSRDWRLRVEAPARAVGRGAAVVHRPPAHGRGPRRRAAELTRTYVAAFLDRHLKGRRQPLLDKPSSRYPEVRFCPAACGPS